MGIMTLPDGEVKTFDKVGSFSLPARSSAWLAYYKGTGGTGGGGGGRGGRRWTRRRRRRTRRAARGGDTRKRRPARNASREKRKDPGSDLILRNLASGEEVTIPEVTEYEWNRPGTWLAYATSSPDAAKDGVFARQISDGSVKTLLSGRGHYKSIAFDEAGTQIAFISDKEEYAQKVSPYRLYYWKANDAPAAELRLGRDGGRAEGHGRERHSRRRASRRMAAASVPWHRRAAAGAARPERQDPGTGEGRLWSYKDPLLQPMQKVRDQQERQRSYRAVVHLGDKRFVQLATPELPNVNAADDPRSSLARPTSPTGRRCRGTRPITTSTCWI